MNINAKFSAMMSRIDAIYISVSLCEMMNEQSCDCDGLVIKCGEKLLLLTSEAIGEDGRIVFEEITSFDAPEYPYEVVLNGTQFAFDKFSYIENGMIEGVRFASGGVFLFVFALEHNLVLTKSKYDLFGEIETDLPEKEATLSFRRTN